MKDQLPWLYNEPHFGSYLFEDPRALLAKAARESLDRIRRDRATALPRLKPLLAHLEDHLFDPDLNVNQLKRACGVRDNSISVLFHARVGESPKAYISARRLETAARLLRDSDLNVWQIGELIGYSGLAVFSKAFERWSGQRPRAYRRELRERPDAETPEAETAEGGEAPPQPFTDDQLRLALRGKLPLPQASALIHFLLDLYPPSDPTDPRSSGGSPPPPGRSSPGTRGKGR